MSNLKLPEVSEQTARQMLDRAKAAKANTYPIANNGYTVTVLTTKGNIYEGISYKSDTMTLTMHCEMTALANAAEIAPASEHQKLVIDGGRTE